MKEKAKYIQINWETGNLHSKLVFKIKFNQTYFVPATHSRGFIFKLVDREKKNSLKNSCRSGQGRRANNIRS